MFLILKLIFIAAGAYLGLSKRLLATWPLLFNLIISIFISIMTTPSLLPLLPENNQPAYSVAIVVFFVAVIVFIILQTIAAALWPRDEEATIPHVIDTWGSFLLGTAAGYITCNFIFLIICLMPFTEIPSVKSFLQKEQNFNLASSVSKKVCDFTAYISLHTFEDQTEKAIENIIDAGTGKKIQNKATRPLKSPDSSPPADDFENTENNKTLHTE